MVECVRKAGNGKETRVTQHNDMNRGSAMVRENADAPAQYSEQIAAKQRRQEALLREYDEVASSFRMLTDIRFKLLAFLPIVAAAAAAVAQESPGVVELGLSLFGLVVTIGLVTYNTRNDQLYGELVGRAAAIERSLGIPEGSIANRPKAWLRIRLLAGNGTSITEQPLA